ncbi:MAG: hypothetical protein ABII01_05630 [Candidatus Woesearchaeota archaeon]
MKQTWLIILVLILIAFPVIWFFPKVISNCSGASFCFGWVYNEANEYIYLVGNPPHLEYKTEIFKKCIGPRFYYMQIMDGCPGSWGIYTDERPFNCDVLIKQCMGEQTEIIGIKCHEIIRACEEIKTKDNVPIEIENLTKTGIFLSSNQ